MRYCIGHIHEQYESTGFTCIAWHFDFVYFNFIPLLLSLLTINVSSASQSSFATIIVSVGHLLSFIDH